MPKSRTLVLGGARSGKSAFAENLTGSLGGSKIYIATAQAFDAEMQQRIAAHVSRRHTGWRTIEAPLDAARAIRTATARDVVLLDCATLWLSNHMLADSDLNDASDDLLAALTECPADIVVVSNEVGFSIVPDSPLGRAFRDAQGSLNQRLADWADLAVLVVAGLPLVLKGTLPEPSR